MDKKMNSSRCMDSPLRCGIVLAGGEGKRLRSFVHRVYGSDLPKQYVNLTGAGSMLENTFRRAEKLIRPEHLFTVISERHLAFVEVQRQLAGRVQSTVIVQPENKDTGPGLLLPLINLYKRFPHSTVAVFPSDHFILEESRFMIHVYLAFKIVEKDPSKFVFLAARPDRPECEYGYIVPGPKLAESFPLDVREVSRFVEKPPRSSASELLQKGGLWNTMVMIFNPAKLLTRFRQLAAALYGSFHRIDQSIGQSRYSRVVRDEYRKIEPVNFSKAILESLCREHPSGLTVLPLCGVYWSDWGSQDRIESGLARMADSPASDQKEASVLEPRARRDAPRWPAEPANIQYR